MEAQAIVNTIRNIVDANTENGARINYEYGVIDNSSAYEVSAFLSGDTDSTDDILLYAGQQVNSGDYAVISTDEHGVQYVHQILPFSLYSRMVADWNNSRILLGDGDSLPVDAGDEGDVLISGGPAGAVTWGSIDVPDLVQLPTYNTPNTLSVDDGHWSLIASGTLNDQFSTVAGECLIGGGGSNTIKWTRGRIRFRVRQQSETPTQPLVALELLDGCDILAADVALVVIDNTDPYDFELYVKMEREYEWMEFVPLWLTQTGTDFTWEGCQAFVTSLPTGTAYTATRLPKLGGSLQFYSANVTSSGASSTTKDYVSGDSLTMASTIMPYDGRVTGIGVRLGTVCSGGTITFQVRNVTTAAFIGPIASITNTGQNSSANESPDSPLEFSAGDRLSLRSTVTAATFAPITSEVNIFVSLAFEVP